ncbi:MAG: peptidylprolyl isomerase [Planctomycetota bacterium]
MIPLLLLATLPLFQEPDDQPARLKPLVPAPEGFDSKPKQVIPPKGPQIEKPAPADVKPVQMPMAQEGMAFAEGPMGARALTDGRPLPFAKDRPLLRVDGVEITAQELNDLVAYYRTFRSSSDDLMLQQAVKALLPMKVMAARFSLQLPDMLQNCEEARTQAAVGVPFEEVVTNFSADTEAPTPDGRYTFGREVAVQPFDRYGFITPAGSLSPSFLTVYGYHFLEVISYDLGDKPVDDQTTVRHVLVMFPEMVTLEKKGEDVRKWIKARVKEAKIEVLEPGMENLVPAANRKQVL